MRLDALRPTMDRLAAGELAGKVLVRPEVSVRDRATTRRASTTSRSAWTRPTLDDRGRADLLAFYGEVFGWTEGDNTGEPGNPLILYTGAFGEFVYLLPGDPYPHGARARPLRLPGRVARRSSTRSSAAPRRSPRTTTGCT